MTRKTRGAARFVVILSLVTHSSCPIQTAIKMFSKHSVQCSLVSILVCCLVMACITIDFSTMISAQPTASIENLFTIGNKLEDRDRDKTPIAKDAAKSSFQQFINSKPQESVVIGEIKPNASDMERLLLRAKIANTIQSMQETDKQRDSSISSSSAPQDQRSTANAECYIEVTRVERVPGKCHRARSGLPICQSDDYMTISSECS